MNQPVRPLYDLDLWIRQTLLDGGGPERVLSLFNETLAQNAVEMGYIQRADGSWRFAGHLVWGPGVTVVEQVPVLPFREYPR